MLRQIIELGSLKSASGAMVVTEYALLLTFSFSEMTVALLIGDVLDFLDMFYAINFMGVKMPTNFQNMAMKIFKSGLIIQNNLYPLLHAVY